MRRTSFLAVLLGTTSVIAIVAASGACGDPSPSRGHPDASGDGSDGYGADIDALGKGCMDRQLAAVDEWSKNPTGPMPDALHHEISGALVVAGKTSWANGETVIPLSPSKCTVLLVQRDAGKVVSETLVHAPFSVTVDTKTFAVHYVPTGIARFAFTSSGETFRGDYDNDGFDEERAEIVYKASAVREHHAPTTDAITERHSGTVVENGTLLELVDEAMIDGVLTKTRVSRTGLRQESCRKPPPPKPAQNWDSWDCSNDAAVNSLVMKSLERGTNCLYAAGMRAEADRIVDTMVHSRVKVDCADPFNVSGFWAANDRGYMDLFPGEMQLYLSTDLLSSTPPSQFNGDWEQFKVGTVGHELFHIFEGHDKDVEASANADQIHLADQVYACEDVCFRSDPTECHLAACLKKTVSTSWHGKKCIGTLKKVDVSAIERARGDGVTIAPCDTGHQVGAVCHAPGNVQFCDTKIECDQACGVPCDSKSVSCLPECR